MRGRGSRVRAAAACIAVAMLAGCSDDTGPGADPTELTFSNLRGSWETDSVVILEAGAPNRRRAIAYTDENRVTWRFEHPQPGYVNFFLAEGGNYWRPYALRGAQVIVEPWVEGGTDVYDAVLSQDALQLADRDGVVFDFDDDGTSESASEARIYLTRR